MWAEGKLFQQFSLLIPISLANADPLLLNASCLTDIDPHESKEKHENVAKAIIGIIIEMGKECAF